MRLRELYRKNEFVALDAAAELLSACRGSWVTTRPADVDHAGIIESLRLPLVVFAGTRMVYRNKASEQLGQWLRDQYATELVTVLRDHVSQIRSAGTAGDTLTLVRLPDGSRLLIDVSPLGNGQRVVTVRAPGLSLAAIADYYQLSTRERRVVEYTVRGLSNQDIAKQMSVSTDTVKKHLTSIFGKVGVDSRTQLVGLFG
jgi:DNA-binding CsgD family transcriptional regulator